MFNKLLFGSKKLLGVALLSLFSLSIVPHEANAADQQPQVAWEKIASGAMVLDVRTPEEFAAGHLVNAVNIPFEQVAAEFAKRGIAKDTPVVLYCRSGRRSGIATDALVAAGYTKTYNGGGYQTLAETQPKTE
ncbi:rhodanese-like domain-containing protein [Shewanella oneidensis MR-1]|uniref:Periplasmic rhodanese domain protein n=1 Tax=Shewanella oneidensis (strain ATCC 700550 / JCM 31522 / CIP 106686 / LMG 19005 / NCIMB 14063 / MR-1) TaxID=211586 RepID=Q8ECN1_SHEON|nr:rhodanese-like domain-containing protein [Shewanella oneidensis]AAN56111.1 periplasmic rhodanese domain protein [Shewanella oneidensis MR-1]MDX5999457.1 rhodanese-like domain-containing protein [Shewanella oneidensis]MEE2028290.1 Thiosulfate sulfurtransferase GlpE [Shewanella oneidensis]QKG97545.1 rhodanese-like domain-containing protein [Shewanella oneidensis MR-1]